MEDEASSSERNEYKRVQHAAGRICMASGVKLEKRRKT